MKKRRLLTAAILTSVILCKPVWAADCTFGTVFDSVTNQHNVVVSPDKTQWLYSYSVYGGGLMYAPLNSFSDNSLTINDTYHAKGLVLATGFCDVTEEENVAHDVVKNNKSYITNADIYAEGYFELTSGYMAHYASGTLNNNGIEISNSKIQADKSIGIYANLVKMGIGSANENYVKIFDSELLPGTGTCILGGHATKGGNAINNTVIISGKNNKSIINNATVYGGLSEYGDMPSGVSVPNDAQTGNANNNSVIIGMANITDTNVYGGYSEFSGSVEKNTVTISGTKDDVSVFNNSVVYGGWTESGKASGNTVNISYANLNGSSIYGGYSANGGKISLNTLNIGEGISGKLKAIGGFNTITFENINWINGGNVVETENLSLVDTYINIKKISGDAKVNETMNLVVSDNEINGEIINAGLQTVQVSAAQSAKLLASNLEQDTNAIKLTIVDMGLNPQVRAISESSSVANAFVLNGIYLVDDTINYMVCNKKIGYKTFAQVNGSNLDFDTSNNLSVKGWGGLVGVGETTEDGLTYGAFFEIGKGDYNTYAEQANGYVRGDGEVDYRGGGVLVRKDNKNGNYIEGSLRAGRMDNELNNAVVDRYNQLRGYDVSGNYYGAHIGIGKIIPRGENQSIDVYGKFLYSYQDGDSFVIDGDTFNLDSINSQRVRVGLRYNELDGSKLRMYYGAAYEYEFDGKANNTVLDYSFSSPDLSGGTIIGELGLHYSANTNWCFDVNLRGYGGMREGISGSVQATYTF